MKHLGSGVLSQGGPLWFQTSHLVAQAQTFHQPQIYLGLVEVVVFHPVLHPCPALERLQVAAEEVLMNPTTMEQDVQGMPWTAVLASLLMC
jgi:hypothetical protein